MDASKNDIKSDGWSKEGEATCRKDLENFHISGACRRGSI